MSLGISHGLDMSWKEWGDFLRNTELALISLGMNPEFPYAPMWFSYLQGAEVLMSDLNYTIVPEDKTAEMASVFKHWISDSIISDDLQEAGVPWTWFNIAQELVDAVERDGGKFSWG